MLSPSRQTVALTGAKSAGVMVFLSDAQARYGGRRASSVVDRMSGVDDMAAMVDPNVAGANIKSIDEEPPPPLLLPIADATPFAQSTAAPAPTPITVVAPVRFAISIPR